MAETPDTQTQKRLADNLTSALFDFLVAADNGTVSHAQRVALTMALEQADALPDGGGAAVNAARRKAGRPP